MLILIKCGYEVRPPQMGGAHTRACAPKSGSAMCVGANQKPVATNTLSFTNFFQASISLGVDKARNPLKPIYLN